MEHKNIKKSVLNDKKYIKNDYKGVEIVLFTPFFTRIKKHDCNKLHLQRLIKNSSKEDDAILDPFGGSGTSIIACEKLNRTAYVMELDPRYVDVIRRRWTKWAAENDVDAGSGALE